MENNLKAKYHKYIRAIFVVLTVCLFLFISGMATPSLANEKIVDLIRHLDASKIRAQLLSQESIHKNLKRNPGDEKMGPGLKEYISQKVSGKALSGIRPDAVAGRNMVRLILRTSDMTEAFSNRINPYGAKVLHRKSGMVVVEVPRTKAEEMITEVDEIEYARKPAVFFPLGEVSEGVDLTGAHAFHGSGVTGSGVKVAVIDAGFLYLTEAQQLYGELPNDVVTHDFSGRGLETEWAHGVGVAEIIHDMAPDAELHLLKVYDEVDTYKAFDYCLDNDIDIINMSGGFTGIGPGNGTGPLADACDELRQDGILFVAAAGNEAVEDWGNDQYVGTHYKGTFTDPESRDLHYYYTDETFGFITIIAGLPAWDHEGNELTNEVDILMRWNDWPYADMDYGIELNEFDLSTGGFVGSGSIAESNAVQNGSQPPIEHITWDIPNPPEQGDAAYHIFALLIRAFSDNHTGTEIELHLSGNCFIGNLLFPEKDHTAILTSSSSITEPADAESVFTVGAINQANWFTGPQEEFSSQGPTNAWAGSGARIKPDIMGPDDVSGLIYGPGSGQYTGFSGTSAAAPHVSGAAALILCANPGLTPDEIQSQIESNAIDMGDPGKDNIYGSGLLQLGTPPPYEYAYQYYFPYFISGSEYWYGVGLKNSSVSEDANVSVIVRNQEGHVVTAESKTLPARGQKAWIVGSGLVGEGWVSVNSDQPLTGLCFIGEDPNITYMADITLINTLSQTLDVPHVAQDTQWDTAVLVCNPNSSSTTVTLTFVDAQGIALDPEEHVIEANGSDLYKLSDLVGEVNYSKGSVEIDADQGVAAFALYDNLKYEEGFSFSFAGISAVDPGVSPPGLMSYDYYLPYFISDSEYWYGVGLRNSNGSEEANISATVYDQGGNVVKTENYTIPARGQEASLVKPDGYEGEGWVRVSSDQPLTGLCFIGEDPNITYMADITLIPALSETLNVPHVAQDAQWDTAVLVCNPNSSSTTVTLTFVDAQGNALYTAEHEIEANGSGRYELLELVGEINYSNGSVEIDADQGVAAFALYYNLKYKEGSSFSFAGISAVDPTE